MSALRAGVFQRHAHQAIEQALEVDLPRNRLRCLDDRGSVHCTLECFGREEHCRLSRRDHRLDGAGCLAQQVRVALVEVGDFGDRTPLRVAVARLRQENARDAWLSPLEPEPPVQLVDQRAVAGRRLIHDRLEGGLIERHRVARPLPDCRDFG